jgi:hypothetical protein
MSTTPLRCAQWLLPVLLLLGSATSVQARTQPVYNVIDKPIHTGSGRTLSLQEVGEVLASAARYKRWTVAEVEEGLLQAQINVRKHFAAIDIRYTETTYSITYRDSKVLKYDGTKIHRNYNKWIKLIEQVADQNFASK